MNIAPITPQSKTETMPSITPKIIEAHEDHKEIVHAKEEKPVVIETVTNRAAEHPTEAKSHTQAENLVHKTEEKHEESNPKKSEHYAVENAKVEEPVALKQEDKPKIHPLTTHEIPVEGNKNLSNTLDFNAVFFISHVTGIHWFK